MFTLKLHVHFEMYPAEDEFKSDIDKLFDIFKPDAQEHLKAEDLAFLEDRRGARKATFGKKDLASCQKIYRKRSAEEAEIHRKEKSQKE